MTTLFRRLIDDQELRDPRAFLPRFAEQARLLAERDGGVRLATLARRQFRRSRPGTTGSGCRTATPAGCWWPGSGTASSGYGLRLPRPLSRHEAVVPSTVRVAICTR